MHLAIMVGLTVLSMSTKVPCYLRTLRREWGLTQKEVADLLPRTSRARVSLLERSCALPNGRELLALSMIFGVPPERIFPALCEATEDAVMRHAYSLYRHLDRTGSREARHKKKLLRRIRPHSRRLHRRSFGL